MESFCESKKRSHSNLSCFLPHTKACKAFTFFAVMWLINQSLGFACVAIRLDPIIYNLYSHLPFYLFFPPTFYFILITPKNWLFVRGGQRLCPMTAGVRLQHPESRRSAVETKRNIFNQSLCSVVVKPGCRVRV